MTHIKKWIIMLVLLITLVPTISHAQSYTADDSYTLTSQYHDLFNNYFDGKLSYTYFPYKCNYGTYNNRECYFGIDSEGNYLKIDYVQNGSSYETRYTTGLDDNFSVSGSNVFKKGVDFDYTFLLTLCFVFLFILFIYLFDWSRYLMKKILEMSIYAILGIFFIICSTTEVFAESFNLVKPSQICRNDLGSVQCENSSTIQEVQWWNQKAYFGSLSYIKPHFPVASVVDTTDSIAWVWNSTDICMNQDMLIDVRFLTDGNEEFFGTIPNLYLNSNQCTIKSFGKGYIDYSCSGVGVGSLNFAMTFLNKLTSQNYIGLAMAQNSNLTCNPTTANAIHAITGSIISGNQELINNQNQNAFNIINNFSQNIQNQIDNANQKTQEIIDNQNANGNIQHELQNQTNQKLDEAQETRKGILGTIRSVLDSIISLPIKIANSLIDGLKSLFIPNDMDFINNFIESIETKLGFIAEVPMSIITFGLNLAQASWTEVTSISFPSISIFGYNFWNAQEINISEGINIFKPFKYITDILLVVIMSRGLLKLWESFSGGGEK